jgi:hypothetical protein
LRTQAQLEAEITMLRHQLNVLGASGFETSADGGRPTSLRPSLPAVPIAEERHHNRATGYGTAVAPIGLPTVLAMEIALVRRPAEGPDRGS